MVTNAVAREPALLDDEEREDDGRRPPRPEPAEEGSRRRSGAGAEQREGDRQHAHDGEAEQRVEPDLPRQVAERGPQQYGSEDDEGDRGEHGSGLLEQIRDLTAAATPEPAVHAAPDEGGDEARATDRLR